VPAHGSGRLQHQQANHILVVIAYYEADDIVKRNLHFLFERGIKQETHHVANVDYIMVVNGDQNTLDAPKLPNVRVVQRENTCFDAGGYSHALDLVKSQSYTHFILMNGSVRGPFLPVYLSGIHWTWAFTSLITEEVKWAGATINCDRSPHVQTPIVVTDRKGLEIIMKAGSLNCSENFPDAITNWEIGSSAAILEAGFNIGSLMTRYKNVDFRNPNNHKCNDSKNPAVDAMNDGLGLDPFEVMFVKVKRTIQLDYYSMVGRYSEYTLGNRSIQLNAWNDQDAQQNIRKALKDEEALVKHCALVFDTEFYALMNKDLSNLPRSKLFKHYMTSGLPEKRLRRFKMAPNTAHKKRNGACNALLIGNLPQV
jgi:hypothetical protein